MVDFKDTIASTCTHASLFVDRLNGWDIIWDDSEDGWQGTVRLLATMQEEYMYIEYSYGSCEGCDGWLGMEHADKMQESEGCIMRFKCKQHLINWIAMLEETGDSKAEKLRRVII